MWILVILLYTLTQFTPIDCQKPTNQRGVPPRPPDDEDMMYRQLSPEAFFSMKDNHPLLSPPRPVQGPIGPGMGPMGPGMGPRGPGMGPMGPGMGPRGPGMGPQGPAGPGMGPARPGMSPQGPAGPGMGPARPGMWPAGPGMGPAGPGMGAAGPGMGAAMPGMGPARPGMGPEIPRRPMGPMKPGMRPARPGIPMGPMLPEMSGKPPVAGPMAPGSEAPEGIDAGDGKKGYEHFDLSIIDDMSRQNKYQENYADEFQIGYQGDDLIIYNLCFSLSYIWRRGRQSIRKYFHLRDIYHNHLPYELGYLTHVIMSKYQTMLELYEYAQTLAKKRKETITRVHVTHFLHSMELDSMAITHLCNMMHEVQNKYKAQPYDPGNRFDVPPSTPFVNRTTETLSADIMEKFDNMGRLHKGHGPSTPGMGKGYLAKQIEESHKEIDKTVAERKKKMKAARDFFKKHGYYPSSTRSQQPMRLWSPNLDYGWSREEDWK